MLDDFEGRLGSFWWVGSWEVLSNLFTVPALHGVRRLICHTGHALKINKNFGFKGFKWESAIWQMAYGRIKIFQSWHLVDVIRLMQMVDGSW